MELHHVNPKSFGGTDEYKNLIWVTAAIHKLIHVTETDTIRKYLEISELDNSELEKLNSLREKAGNRMIDIEI